MNFNQLLSLAFVTGFGTFFTASSLLSSLCLLIFAFFFLLSAYMSKLKGRDFTKMTFFILDDVSCIEEWFPEMQSKFKLHLLFDTTAGEHKKIASIY